MPISPDLDLSALVENTPNFDYVTRLPRAMLEEHSNQSLEQLVLLHVVIGGKPLIIEGWENSIDPGLFGSAWLQSYLDKQVIRARDIPNGVDVEMTMGHYLRNLHLLANQFTSSNFRHPKRQRLYLKDMDIPEEWAIELKRIIPETFFYLNECIESRTGGDGARLEPNEYGQMRYGKGVAPAGDLMSSLPTEMQALNMMCYIGHEGTYTPAHREMCASLGHNIMVEASNSGDGEIEGSSIWFMTETKEREVVSEYFLSMLGHDIEVEKHFAQVNAWKKAPFNVWVVEQRPGDLILIPPLAPHQVWNRGTRTIKAAWNRTTVDTLELALHEALPRARMVCRDEQYKNKAIIYYTLMKYHGLLFRDSVEPKMWRYGRIKQLLEDFKRLFQLYGEILVSEMFGSALPPETDVEFLPYDSNVTCSYCRCNIFNRFLTCTSCNTGPDDTYDICMDCYAMGRSCSCISNLNWVEQWSWSTLVQSYESWRQTLVQCDGYFDSQKSPQPLEIARKRYGRKPVAQICQEQLKIRPWQDPTKPKMASPSPGMSDIEPEVDDNGRPKKKQRTTKKVRPVKNKTSACHIGQNHEWNWKLAFCTTCSNKYSYGSLWRAFDIMPQEVMEDRDWSCPKCQGICSCGKCRRDPKQKPYSPKGTLLGHDTRSVADLRSVESLVDFSRTNLGWLRDEGNGNPRESARMRKLKEKAEAAKAREDVIDENYFDNSDQQMNENTESMVDPELEDHAPANFSILNQSQANGTYESPYSVPPADQNFGSDGHYDPGSHAFGRPSTGYPSGLVAPALMTAPQQDFINPTEFTKAKMAGIGYYQQSGSADQILYIPPNTEDASAKEGSSAAANLALSDLMQEQQLENSKKRKSGDRGEDEKLVTPRRQKKLSAAKRYMQPLNGNTYTSTNMQRKPRRSAGKLRTSIELGEDSLPFSDEDGVALKPEFDIGEDDDSLFGPPDAQETGNESQIQWHTSARNPHVKVAEPVPCSNGSMPRRRGRPSKPVVNIPKAKTEDAEEDEQPLFEETGTPTTESVSNVKQNIETLTHSHASKRPRPEISQNKGKSVQNRRGRRPKQVAPVTKSVVEIQLSRPSRMLSLKEKLTMKGKSFKIVAPKSHQSLSSPIYHPSIKSSPSAVEEVPEKATAANRNSTLPNYAEYGSLATSSAKPDPNDSTVMASAQMVEGPKQTFSVVGPGSPSPITKAPTVVRLMSPEDESDVESDVYYDSSTSGGSIPAVKRT